MCSFSTEYCIYLWTERFLTVEPRALESENLHVKTFLPECHLYQDDPVSPGPLHALVELLRWYGSWWEGGLGGTSRGVSTASFVSRRWCHGGSFGDLLKVLCLEILNVQRENFIADGVEPCGLLGGGTGGGRGTEQQTRGAEVEESGQSLQLVNERRVHGDCSTACMTRP